MTIYEMLVLLEPLQDRAEIDAILKRISGQIEKCGGVIKNVNEWGIKRLAYEVKRKVEGFYVLYEFHADGKTNAVRGIEDFLKLQAPIMRFKTTTKPAEVGPQLSADHPSLQDHRFSDRPEREGRGDRGDRR